MSNHFPSLPNMEYLIDSNGEITLGNLGPIRSYAVPPRPPMVIKAAMLIRRNNEPLGRLLYVLTMLSKKLSKTKPLSTKSIMDQMTDSKVVVSLLSQQAVGN